jgi:SAM-dependent methyltransferase
VDLSDAAILAARDLSKRTGIPATFVRADLYEWLDTTAREGTAFDVVFASYGVVCWLSDLDRWGCGIASVLKPGGIFVLVDFHPLAEVFDGDWSVVRDYPSGGEKVLLDEGVGDYVGDSAGGLTPGGFIEGERDFSNPEPASLFRWGLGEVVTALAGAGLKIERLEEYPYANGERHFAGMREIEGRRMYPPERLPAIPLTYGLRAGKPAVSGQ